MAETVFTWDTKLSADTVEWCPNEGYEQYFALGTYQVEKDEQKESFTDEQRYGKLHLFESKAEQNDFQLVNEQETRAILDMKWSSSAKEMPLLALTTSSGQLVLYQLEKSKLEQKDVIMINEDLNPDYFDSDSKFPVVLSLDWNDRNLDYDQNKPLRIATSDSSGHISILSFEDGQEMRIIDKRKNHDFEAWICAFDVWNSNVVYSGGDDSKLFLTDLRADSKKRIGVHDAGVTSLLSDIFHEHWLFSGSYDEKLRLWDTRKTKQPLETHNAEGGIWRIRQPRNKNQKCTIGLACMHNGFQVLDVKEEDCKIEKLDQYNQHQSLAYGLDFRSKTSENELQLASCSFYDSLLNVWNLKLDG